MVRGFLDMIGKVEKVSEKWFSEIRKSMDEFWLSVSKDLKVDLK